MSSKDPMFPGYSYNSIYKVMSEKKSNDLITYHKGLERLIYGNELLISGQGMQAIHHTHVGLNSHGYRSDEFISNVDMLVGGCSVTHGTGLDYEDTWPQIVKNKLGITLNLIAKEGEGVQEQVTEIFAYFKKYGHPKYLFCLFPPLERMSILRNDKTMLTEPYIRDRHSKTFDEDSLHMLSSAFKLRSSAKTDRNLSNLHRAPFVADDVINIETAHMYSSQYIHMLDMYCQAAGIKFAWSTWHPEMQKLIDSLRVYDYFPNEIDIKMDYWDLNFEDEKDYLYDKSIFGGIPEDANRINCHLEDMPQDSDTWHYARDIDRKYKRSHYGQHRNIHIADTIMQYMKDNWL